MLFYSVVPVLLQATLSLARRATARGTRQLHNQVPINSNLAQEPWTAKYRFQEDLQLTGPLSLMHMEHQRCLSTSSEEIANRFDIAVLGMPFDTKVSYRPGARFGPFAIRSGSRRLSESAYDFNYGLSPYQLGAKILDCGDVPVSIFDPVKALDQMETAYTTLLDRPVRNGTGSNPDYHGQTAALAKDGNPHPRIVTLGGDHTIVLPILRSLHRVYGPISVIHFDAHLDTWDPKLLGDTPEEEITHGTFFAIAAREGLMSNNSVHAGIRTRLFGPQDLTYDNDTVGFQVISAEDLDDYGIPRILEYVRKRVGETPVYLSLDIDVIDPSMAPGTGTPEIGGWTTREVKRLIRGLGGLNIVGADVAEVSPSYDHADITAIAAADIVYDMLNMMQMHAPPPLRNGPLAFKVIPTEFGNSACSVIRGSSQHPPEMCAYGGRRGGGPEANLGIS